MRSTDLTSAPLSSSVSAGPSDSDETVSGKPTPRQLRDRDGFELAATRRAMRHHPHKARRKPVHHATHHHANHHVGPSQAMKATAFGISREGREQMKALSTLAGAESTGREPDGKCYKHVKNFLDHAPYGLLGEGGAPYLAQAHMVADWLNTGDRLSELGLKKLPITNPYQAPEGSIIVVRAGTPGTHHPTAGDIVVKGPGDHFYNGGEMGYHGPQSFPPGNDFVLGIYAPK